MWRCLSNPWGLRAPSTRRTTLMRPWRMATGIGPAPAEPVGARGFADWEPSLHGPGTCSGPKSRSPRASPCGMSRTRRSLRKTPPGTTTTRQGGGMVVADPETGWRQSYAIPIQVHVDRSSHAELYVAWEVLRARRRLRVMWGTRGQQWSFQDTKGYIDAVQSRNPGS